MKELGIYIHIPFCKRKCYYCDFISYTNKENCVEKYIETVKKEIKIKLQQKENYIVTTIYIGGGTPSFIDSKYIKELIQEIYKTGINVSENVEITIEVNPGTVNTSKIKEYKDAGINRISIGLQSAQDRLLKQIGRIHSYEEFVNTYKIIRDVGIQNVNVDIMIGLPNQAMADVEETLDKIITLKPEHISIYSLIVEEGTVIYDRIEKGEEKLPSEELERKMYWFVKSKVKKAGYYQYEISNFSKKGYESKHNMNCWEQKEYLGFGAAAHSYIEKKRFSNKENIEEYIQDEKFEGILNEVQNKKTQMQEYMILGLRKINGVSILAFKNKFAQNPIYIFREQLHKLVNNKLIKIDGDKILLTKKGLNLANIVWEEFI